MAKKSKDSSTKPKPNPQPTHTNIFSKLFVQTLDSDQPPISLFSPNNPFLPKPIQNPNLDNVTSIEVDQKKRKKGSHDKSDSLRSDSVRKSTKEPKLIDGSNPNFENNPDLGGNENPNLGENDGVQSKLDGVQNPNFGGGDDGVEVKGKKKRKRDEIEREYESKRYGGEVVKEEEEKRVVVVGKKRKAMDDPEEMKVSSEGYDDESKLLRTVFVGNLPLKMKKKGLFKVFSKFGEIESVRIRSVPTLDGKKPKKVQIISGKINEAADSVHAYIVFKTEQSAEASLSHNMSVVEGNHIRVDRACPPRKKLKEDGASAPLYNNKRTAFVGNLPFDVKDEELYQLFCGIKQLEDSVEAVRVVRDRSTSLGKGIAYVLFKTREAANFACKKRYLKIRDRELRICHAKSESQSTPTKRKIPFEGNSESTPSKKYSSGEKTPKSRYQVNTKGGDTSYQGLRASKTDEKKKSFPSRGGGAHSRPGGKAKEKVKQRTEKRPSVAARKAKADNGGGVSKMLGKKRKMDGRTPQSGNKSKKAKKFK